MRKLKKGNKPAILESKSEQWTQDFASDPENDSIRFRYRHPDIKAALLAETHCKCVYCESKIGHNCPGDTEHIVPVSIRKERAFDWENLTIACSICNTYKGSYYDEANPFLNTYTDDVEGQLEHQGPIVNYMPGNICAEITVKRLKLNTVERIELIKRKVEHMIRVTHLRTRIADSKNITLKELLQLELNQMQDKSSEYSAMTMALCGSDQKAS